MTTAVIFDLNGVFIQSPKLSDRFAEAYHIPSETFLPVLSTIMSKVRQPNAGPAFPYWEPYFQEWGLGLSETAFFDFWFSAEQEVRELTEAARKLREKGLRLFILSNNFVERARYYEEHFPFLQELFEKVYYSFETGFVKPHPLAYQTLLRENGLEAGECLYFDDTPRNIEVASSLGIPGHVVNSTEELKQQLANL